MGVADRDLGRLGGRLGGRRRRRHVVAEEHEHRASVQLSLWLCSSGRPSFAHRRESVGAGSGTSRTTDREPCDRNKQMEEDGEKQTYFGLSVCVSASVNVCMRVCLV